MQSCAIILAAGKGTRMRSRLPKVAHRVGGLPLIAHVHSAVTAVEGVVPIYVLGHMHETVRELLPEGITVVLQEEQRGTGHAVQMALPAIPAACTDVLVLYGDMPLIRSETLTDLRAFHREHHARLTVLSARVSAPFGYGRVIRDATGTPEAVIEEKELTNEQRVIDEINSGVYVIDVAWLRVTLPQLPQHGDAEYYLTDLVGLAAAGNGLAVSSNAVPEEILGINDRRQLAQAEHIMRLRTAQRLMDQGVTLIDPAATYIAADATIGCDTVIEPNVWIGEGVTIGESCYVGMNTRIIASSLGDRCLVSASVLEYAVLESDVAVGPFAHLRVGATIESTAHVGNFAEIKNSVLRQGAKVPHFSYVGDATVGERVNFGAGAITANFDGSSKHRTEIGHDAFIGSGSILRAPLTVGVGALTGAGSVVTHDVHPGEVVFGVPARPRGTPQPDARDGGES